MKRKSYKEDYKHTIDLIKYWKDRAKVNLEATPNNDLGEQTYYRAQIDFAELILMFLGEDK